MMDIHDSISSIQMKVTEKMKGFPQWASMIKTDVHEAMAALVETMSEGHDDHGPSSPTATEGSRNATFRCEGDDDMYGTYSQQDGDWNAVNLPDLEPVAIALSNFPDVQTRCPEEEEDDDSRQNTEDFYESDDDDDSSHGSFESKEMDPLKVLKKGAVAALGGTMVGVGLIMIPLPTPFGAVVASSGMAVLGTEFEGAKELNDKMISQAKTHWKTAREKIVQGIEEMNKDNTPTEMKAADAELVGEERLEVHEVLDEQQAPKLMNDLEAKRQAQLVEQSRRTKRPEFVDEWRKNAGAYLTKHLVPLLTTPLDDDEKDGSLPDASSMPTIQSDDSDMGMENAQVTECTPLTVVRSDSKDQETECGVVTTTQTENAGV